MHHPCAVLIGAFFLLLSPVTAEVRLSTRLAGVALSSLNADNVEKLSDAAKTVAREFAAVYRMLELLARFINKGSAEESSEEPKMAMNVLIDRAQRDEHVVQHLFGLTVPADIGSPAQRQDLMLSFFSSHFWVASQELTFSHLIKNCFNESLSRTLDKTNEKFKLRFSEYSAAGHYITDTVKLSDFVVTGHRFGVADSASYVFPLLRVNGVLGLTSSKEGDALSNLLVNEREAILTLYHNPLADILSNATNAVLANFGNWNDSLCENDWKTVVASRDPFWQVTVEGATIDNSNVRESSAGKAMIASTLPLTFVPESTFAQIAFSLGAVQLKKEAGIYMLRCWSLPTIYFRINGKEIPLTPDSYTIKVAGVCFLRIMPMSPVLTNTLGVDYVFAEPLLRSNCVRFAPRTSEISFATPKPQELQYHN